MCYIQMTRCADARHSDGVNNVNRTEQRESATIIPFPVRARADASHRQPNLVEDLPVVDSASWYHEAAMREDEAAGTH
jgi:hypothetical protein